MKFTANRAELLAQVKTVLKAIPSRASVDVLLGILVEADPDQCEVALTGTNYEVSIQCKLGCPVEAGGSVVINARLLAQMLTLLGDETVTLTVNDRYACTIASGEASFCVMGQPGKNYPKPELPFPEDTIQVSRLSSMAKNTVYAVSKDEKQPVMGGVRLELCDNTLRICGCDGKRLMESKQKSESPGKLNLIIPAHSFGLLTGLVKDTDVLELGIAGSNAVFSKENFLFSTRLVPGVYLDVDQLLKGIKSEYTAVVDAKKLAAAIDSLSVIAGASSYINICFTDGRIKLACESETGDSRSSVEAELQKETPATGFFYTVSYLLEAFKRMSGKVELQLSSIGMLYVETDTDTYFQVPVRPQPVKKESSKPKTPVKAKPKKAA